MAAFFASTARDKPFFCTRMEQRIHIASLYMLHHVLPCLVQHMWRVWRSWRVAILATLCDAVLGQRKKLGTRSPFKADHAAVGLRTHKFRGAITIGKDLSF